MVTVMAFNMRDFINNYNGTHKLEMNKFYYNPEYYPGYKETKTEHCSLVDDNYGVSLYGTKFDWRDTGVVTPIKNQGHCGSCWSFSATGAMEGAWAIKTGNLVSFSEQDLMDCSTCYNDMGCNGGEMTSAFEYAIDNGICTESDVPYKIETHDCNLDKCNTRYFLKDCKTLPRGDQAAMMRYIQVQPLSVAIQANQAVFRYYKSGVITTVDCGQNTDHGVLVVGYGTEDGHDYWLVKNSWGTDWGDKGYVKIDRSMSRNDMGVCGIASSVSFPTL